MGKKDSLTEDAIANIFADPFYCLPKVAQHYVCFHKAMVTEEQWIKVASLAIAEEGAEVFLRRLLANLKGETVK